MECGRLARFPCMEKERGGTDMVHHKNLDSTEVGSSTALEKLSDQKVNRSMRLESAKIDRRRGVIDNTCDSVS